MNNVTLIDCLTVDLEFRFLPERGKLVTKFNLAVDKGFSRDKRQELEQKGISTVDFPRIVVWGRQAENCATFLEKKEEWLEFKGEYKLVFMSIVKGREYIQQRS